MLARLLLVAATPLVAFLGVAVVGLACFFFVPDSTQPWGAAAETWVEPWWSEPLRWASALVPALAWLLIGWRMTGRRGFRADAT